jgi:hypothetical protein
MDLLAGGAVQGDIRADKAHFGRRAEDVFQDVQAKGVGVDVFEEEILVERGRQGYIAGLAALDVPESVFGIEVVGVRAHLAVHRVFMLNVDGVAEGDDAVTVESLEGFEDCLVGWDAGFPLILADVNYGDIRTRYVRRVGNRNERHLERFTE